MYFLVNSTQCSMACINSGCVTSPAIVRSVIIVCYDDDMRITAGNNPREQFSIK